MTYKEELRTFSKVAFYIYSTIAFSKGTLNPQATDTLNRAMLDIFVDALPQGWALESVNTVFNEPYKCTYSLMLNKIPKLTTNLKFTFVPPGESEIRYTGVVQIKNFTMSEAHMFASVLDSNLITVDAYTFS